MEQDIGAVRPDSQAETEIPRTTEGWANLMRETGGAQLYGKMTLGRAAARGRDNEFQHVRSDENVSTWQGTIGSGKAKYLRGVEESLIGEKGATPREDYLLYYSSGLLDPSLDDLLYLQFIQWEPPTADFDHRVGKRLPLTMTTRIPADHRDAFLGQMVDHPEMAYALPPKLFDEYFADGTFYRQRPTRLCIINGNSLANATENAMTVGGLTSNIGTLNLLTAPIRQQEGKYAGEAYGYRRYKVKVDGVQSSIVPESYKKKGDEVTIMCTDVAMPKKSS